MRELSLDWLGSIGKKAKGVYIRNRSENMAAVATSAILTGLNGNGGDGGNKMTATAVAQDLLMIRRRQQQDIGDCGRKGGGANLA